MSTAQSEKCLLCDGPAEFFLVDYENRRHFFCDHCTEYQVSRAAKKILSTAPKDWKVELSERARKANQSNSVLCILMPKPKQIDNVVFQTLSAEPISREDIPKP
jgi:hypothetical protein